jgi:regulator of protease activity HflC (stomatin/prohibitin superfamily)
MKGTMKMKANELRLVAVGVMVVILTLATIISVDTAYLAGNQVGIQENWFGEGVSEGSLSPGMKAVVFGKILSYDMSPNILVMNDRRDDERANGRNSDAYVAKSSDNQDMTMWLALQWRFDPAKIVDIHKAYRTHTGMKDWDTEIEERLIRQVLIRTVNTEATGRTAIEAYSGPGFVDLQNSIADALIDPNGELRQQGIIIENFAIEQIRLDQEYIGEIRQRQVAQQRTLRAQEEEKAALAEAARAQAEAKADYNKQVVEAEREKQKVVLESEGAAQQRINNAKAEAEEVRLAAQASRDAAILEAQGIEALGAANAEAQRLQLQAYAVDGADAFVQIEVAKSMAVAFQNIQGYLPENMKINLLSSSFLDSLKSVVGGVKAVPVPTEGVITTP